MRFLKYFLLLSFLCFGLMPEAICGSHKKEKILSYCYTPQQFGAVGDGLKDDTNALRLALYRSSRDGVVLYFPPEYKYRVSGTLNFYKGRYRSYVLNMLGSIPIMKESYKPEKYGGILLKEGVRLFKDAKISGSIERMCISGPSSRDVDTYVFDNCTCSGLVIHGCNFANLGAMFVDTSLDKVCKITDSNFLTVYYFAKNDKTSAGMTDSIISGNYINGGMELNDNACFQWAYFNGDIISNNFIDSYRTIYEPKATSRQPFVGPLSYSNQYQVFRYFFMPGENIGTVSFSSNSDSFNWNDPEMSEKVKNYTPVKYTGKDGNFYDFPPYVACCSASWQIDITSAKVERNMRSLVFVYSSITEYENSRFVVSFVGNNKTKPGQINYRQGDKKPFFNGGRFCYNAMSISGIIEVKEHLPHIGIGWSSSVNGQTIMVGNTIYKAQNFFDGTRWSSKWVKLSDEK